MAVQIYYQSVHDIVINEQLLLALQPKRREQLFSFRFEADKKRCAAAGLLLWEHLYHRHPEQFTVSYNAAGKPSVLYRSDFISDTPNSSAQISHADISTPSVPFFNLSHSNDFVMLAISDTPVGCDIERVHKAILSHHVFHPKELARLLSLPEGDVRDREFLRLWTAKEAFLKAIGTGIDENAASYDLSDGGPIHLADGSVWVIEHPPLPESYKESYRFSSLSPKSSSQCLSEDFSEYHSCICYKYLQ